MSFQDFLSKFDPEFLRCVVIADQAEDALLRVAQRCEVSPACVAYCMWVNLTKQLYQTGLTDTELVSLVYHITTHLADSDTEDEDEE